MAFPEVLGTPAQSQSSSGATHTVSLPSGLVAKKLLIAIVGVDNGASDDMTGWTKKGWWGNATSGTTGQGTGVWVKEATGSDTGSVGGSGSKARFSHAYQIEGWTGNVADVLVSANTTSSINPPNLNMTTAADHLWLAVARNNSDITTAPTNFTDMIETNFFSAAWLASSRRQFNASSLDPGTYGGTLNAGHALTIGIRPGTYDLATATGNFLPFFA